MKKYKASEIIERAMQLADLENSDFISDSEKIGLLNESFIQLFQKVVDSGDKTWQKSITVTDGMDLPEDLYQIAAIYVTAGKEPIFKINANQLCGYDVINNTLYLSGEYKGISVTMDYVPVPPTIQLKEKKLLSPYPVTPVNACNNIYAYVDGDTSHVIVADLNDKTMTLDIGAVGSDIEVFKNGVLVKGSPTKFFSFDCGDLADITDRIICLDGNLYQFDTENRFIQDWEGYTLNDSPLDVDTENLDGLYADAGFKNIYAIYNSSYRYNNGESVAIPADSLEYIKGYVTEEGLYLCSKFGSIYLLQPNGIKTISVENKGRYIVSKKYVLTCGGLGSTYYLEGVRDDDLLSYPNQLFYVLLAYMLALQFKIKQGADTSGLSAEYQKAEVQFFDSISRDNNANYTIRNVYKTRRFF